MGYRYKSTKLTKKHIALAGLGVLAQIGFWNLMEGDFGYGRNQTKENPCDKNQIVQTINTYGPIPEKEDSSLYKFDFNRYKKECDCKKKPIRIKHFNKMKKPEIEKKGKFHNYAKFGKQDKKSEAITLEKKTKPKHLYSETIKELDKFVAPRNKEEFTSLMRVYEILGGGNWKWINGELPTEPGHYYPEISVQVKKKFGQKPQTKNRKNCLTELNKNDYQITFQEFLELENLPKNKKELEKILNK